MSGALAEREERSALDQLTDKERLFVAYYCGPAHCDGNEAARMLGYKHHGSEYQAAWRLLKSAEVQAAIREVLSLHLDMDAGECMRRLSAVARCDLRQYYQQRHEDGCSSKQGEECDCCPSLVLDPRKGDWSLVNGTRRDRQGRRDVELPSKVEALALIARRHALLTDRQVQSTQEVYDVEWTTPAIAQEGAVLEESDTPSPNGELTEPPALPAGEASE